MEQELVGMVYAVMGTPEPGTPGYILGVVGHKSLRTLDCRLQAVRFGIRIALPVDRSRLVDSHLRLVVLKNKR